jgi:hypothetical protein
MRPFGTRWPCFATLEASLKSHDVSAAVVASPWVPFATLEASLKSHNVSAAVVASHAPFWGLWILTSTWAAAHKSHNGSALSEQAMCSLHAL